MWRPVYKRSLLFAAVLLLLSRSQDNISYWVYLLALTVKFTSDRTNYNYNVF